MDAKKIQDLEKQGYRIVGNHSAIKVCMWTKKCILGKDVCYKNTFYGIQTHRCVQMTPALHVCTQRCLWCWRDIGFTQKSWHGAIDDPKDIVDGCIDAHIKYLYGFGGNKDRDKKMFEESMHPLHFAISLSGEPTLYPRLPELIDEINSRGMTTFLVTNGTNPEMLKKLKGHEPTQLYITLPAPDRETYMKSCAPLIPGAWELIMQSLDVLKILNTRKTIRLTLAKDINMLDPKGYAELFKKIDADFFEIKGYVWVGYSRERLEKHNMPFHEDVRHFAQEIIKHCPELRVIDEKENSRVILLAKKERKDRIMRF